MELGISVSLIVTFIIGGVGTILWYLIKEKIKRQDEDILKREQETVRLRTEQRLELDKIWGVMDEFKENYLDRFENVNHNINASRETLCEMIHQLDKKIK